MCKMRNVQKRYNENSERSCAKTKASSRLSSSCFATRVSCFCAILWILNITVFYIFRAERDKYVHHRYKAKRHPDRYLSLIIDTMDQNKTDIPHFAQCTKTTSAWQTLPSHLTGVLIHGIGALTFFDHKEFSKDSNMNCTIIVETLKRIKAKRGVLPKTLYLQVCIAFAFTFCVSCKIYSFQADNAADNKNRYLFALCCYLVETKIMDKIRINFLMVG